MTSQRSNAYDQIYALIEGGELRPGDRVFEAEIGKMLGLSRTPVREAIRRLEAEGIITHSPHIGAIVRKLDHQELVEIYELRLVLEDAAASLAAQHASQAEIILLRELNENVLSASEERKAARENAKFHALIFQAARNRFLMRSFDDLSRLLVVLGSTTIANEARRDEVHAQHAKIIDAIEARSAGDAKLFAHEHLLTSLGVRLRETM